MVITLNKYTLEVYTVCKVRKKNKKQKRQHTICFTFKKNIFQLLDDLENLKGKMRGA